MNATLTPATTDRVQQSFAQACMLLAQARWNRSVKDTPSARLHVDLCRAEVDAILDGWNDAHRRTR